MNWTVFADDPPSNNKWQRYHVTLGTGEIGTAIYSHEAGFYNISVNGVKKPIGTRIVLWSPMQE